MDMRQYMGTSYFNVDDIAPGGPRQETILDVQIGNYGRPDLHFADGNRLSLNVTNTRTLGRAYGTDSKDWIDKIIELYVGEIETKDGNKHAITCSQDELGDLEAERADLFEKLSDELDAEEATMER